MESAKSFFETPSPARFTGIWSWLLTTDHKRIGLMYLFAILFWFLLAVLVGGLLRLELMFPGETIMGAELYNSAFTLHGVIMIFLFIIPAMPAIFGNFILPMQIGTDDVFFPKLNLLSWYLYMLGGLIAIVSLFSDGFPDTGWTFYVPFSISTHTNVSSAVFAAFVLGIASMITGLNFITTIHRMRKKEMGWMQIPLFTWSLYATSWVQLLATPVISVTLLLVIIERYFGVGLFDPAKGGDPILFQHLFWMYSHPAVYIMILPGMGVISEIIPVFSRKSIFGYKAIVFSSLAIAVAGSLVWAHHMYTSGMSDTAVFVFSLLTFVVAIPSAIKVFSWVATLYKGSIQMTPPFFLALCFIYLFSVGGLTGLLLGSVGTDIHVHDTHFVVSHFHFTMSGGAGIAFFAALHYWWPKMSGRMYRLGWGQVSALIIFIGFNLTYFPQFIIGSRGMPRRYFDYTQLLEAHPEFTFYQMLSTTGGFLLVGGLAFVAFNLGWSLFRGPKAPDNPWGAATLEWHSTSPPSTENFVATGPVGDCYSYDDLKYDKETRGYVKLP